MKYYIKLKAGREKSVQRRHPWIFSGAIESESPGIPKGESVEIRSSKNEVIATGSYSPDSQIRSRIWAFSPVEMNPDFISTAIRHSIARRKGYEKELSTNALRLINAEADFLPGLTVDKYDNIIVCQIHSSGAEYFRTTIIATLSELYPDASIYEKSDDEVRAREGLPPSSGLLKGQDIPDEIEISENGFRILVDIKNGHKTGFYLDQRAARKALMKYAEGKTVLNCFSYSGAFSMAALKAGAQKLINVDSSLPALETAEKNRVLNGFAQESMENIADDVFKYLRKCRDAARKYDIIILDPPKFADMRSRVEDAARGYKDINLLAMKLLNPGGILLSFSCSGAISPEFFQKLLADAATDASKDFEILEHTFQDIDHSSSLAFPEGLYLKGLICRLIR